MMICGNGGDLFTTLMDRGWHHRGNVSEAFRWNVKSGFVSGKCMVLVWGYFCVERLQVRECLVRNAEKEISIVKYTLECER